MTDQEAKSIGQKQRFFSVSGRLKAKRGEPVRETKPLEWETIAPADYSKEEEHPSDILYNRAIAVLDEFFDSARDGRPVKASEVHAIAGSLIDNVLASQALEPSDLASQVGQSIFLRAFYYESNLSDLKEHALNVAILSAKLGSLLDYSHSDLLRLSFSALIHNVGMIFIPPKLLNRRETLSVEEWETIRSHSKSGFDFIRTLGQDYYSIADVVYQVHERENGQGYPEGLSGGEIHMDAKIIGISDVYAAMSKPRAYRQAFLPFDAMQAIIQTMEEKFAPHIVRALLQALSIFPIGSLVRLNSGIIGRVAAANPERPMRPVIEVLIDERDMRIDPPRSMDLTEYPHLHIKGAISREVVSHLLS